MGRMEVTADQSTQALKEELIWFQEVVNQSITLYFENQPSTKGVRALSPPDIKENGAPYAQLLKENNATFADRVLLMLAVVPHVQPQMLDVFFIRNQELNCDYSEFGGVKSTNRPGFQPTFETACFILGGHYLEERIAFIQNCTKNHFWFAKGVLDLDVEIEFILQQPIRLSHEYFGYIFSGERHLPQYSSKFPAREIKTELNWEDLVINDSVRANLMEVKDWLVHSETILQHWQLHKNLKLGFKVLFYGPPGTGKTLAATLLGKTTHQAVFRVDLSLVVSKYIGETEKNLGRLFDEAENKGWILFFDEADALFGKRTQTKGANDRYANQEIAFLLQRIEEFNGLVILATNIQTNIDEAFSRRFQSMVHFPNLSASERVQLWQNLLSELELSKDVNLHELSEKYELSGGEMVNVLRFCALEAAKRGSKAVPLADLIIGIRREYNKKNKTI